MSERFLVRGRWIVTSHDSVLQDGAVLVEDGTIRALGPWQQLRERYPDVTVHGSDHHALLPGLINAHHHSNGVTVAQQGIPDLLLESWLLTLARRRRLDPYLATLLSTARLLRSGVTTVVDVHSGRGSPDAFAQPIHRALAAYDRSGMRVAYAIGMNEQSFLVWGEDERFLASLPPEARAVAQQRLPATDSVDQEAFFGIFGDLWEAYQQKERISLWFAPPGPQWCSDAFWLRIAEEAERYDTGIQTHLLESLYEKLHGPRSYGRPTLLHLQSLGVLGPRISFAHGVWLSEEEIEALAGSGASVSHNPGSNLRLRAGIAPLNAMLAAGVNVALGMDGTTLNDDEEMFTEMRLALRLHRDPRLDGPVPTSSQILKMATAGGARLLRADSRLGRIAPGYAADLLLLRLDRITWPWVAPEADPLELLMLRAQAGDLDSVWIDGEMVWSGGRPTRFDPAEVGREAAEVLAATPFPEEEAAMVEQLLPLVEAYYRGWPVEQLDPYVIYNSRR